MNFEDCLALPTGLHRLLDSARLRVILIIAFVIF
jgi:hypothetical protein